MEGASAEEIEVRAAGMAEVDTVEDWRAVARRAADGAGELLVREMWVEEEAMRVRRPERREGTVVGEG